MEYEYKRKTNLSYENAVKKTIEELKKEGFGVLTEVDVKATLKNKLGVNIGKYIILGVCNPKNAYRSIKVEQDIGLFLPCNVIVYEKQGKTKVSAIRPSIAMQMIKNDRLKPIAQEIELKLKRAIDNV